MASSRLWGALLWGTGALGTKMLLSNGLIGSLHPRTGADGGREEQGVGVGPQWVVAHQGSGRTLSFFSDKSLSFIADVKYQKSVL